MPYHRHPKSAARRLTVVNLLLTTGHPDFVQSRSPVDNAGAPGFV